MKATLLVLLCVSFTIVNGISDEKRLIKFLLASYENQGKEGRPVTDPSSAVKLQLSVKLVNLHKVEEENELVTIKAWMFYKWVDISLTWNPVHFGGIQSVKIPIDGIWAPDITLYNGFNTRILNEPEALAVAFSNGTVLWVPPVFYTAMCPMELTTDKQELKFKFGSWVYSDDEVEVDFMDGQDNWDVSQYVENRKWELVEYSAVRNLKRYDCCPDPYVDLTYTLVVKKRGSD